MDVSNGRVKNAIEIMNPINARTLFFIAFCFCTEIATQSGVTIGNGDADGSCISQLTAVRPKNGAAAAALIKFSMI